MAEFATQLANEHADICHANGLRIHDGAVWDGEVYAFSFGYPEDPQTLRRLIQAYQTGQARANDRLDALREEIDLLRARAPRAYILTRATEWQRMFREAIGYLNTCRRQHHGTDLAGRHHLIDALEAAMKELGEPESERRARAIAELNADEANATARSTPASSTVKDADT